MRRLRAWILLLLAAPFACQSEPATLTVAAATSLRTVFPDLTFAFRKKYPGTRVRATFGASGGLRQQVVAGAPIDVVVFADEHTVDALIAGGDADAASKRFVAQNQLVLIGPNKGPVITWNSLDKLGPRDHLAIGEPGAVPAGRYARDALRALGKWQAVKKHLVFGGDVGAVLTYVRRGEVVAGVVYATEIRGINDVRVFERAQKPWAPTAQVVSARVTASGARDQARLFLLFLQSEEARTIFAAHGFSLPEN